MKKNHICKRWENSMAIKGKRGESEKKRRIFPAIRIPYTDVQMYIQYVLVVL